MAPYSDMISMDTTALGTPEPIKPRVHAVNDVPPTPPLSTSSSSISSTSYRERSDSDNVATGRSRAPRTPRRLSRVQSMPVGSEGALDFFGTPPAISSSVPSTPLGVRKTITDPPSVPELGDFNDIAVEEQHVVETKTVKVCHSSVEEKVKISEEKKPNDPPPPGTKPDIGKVDARCQQCIIL